VEGLEDEADVASPHPRQRPLAELVGAAAGKPQFATRRPVQPAEQVLQGGLPATTGQRRTDAARHPHADRAAGLGSPRSAGPLWASVLITPVRDALEATRPPVSRGHRPGSDW
jgi:hypothetical protein